MNSKIKQIRIKQGYPAKQKSMDSALVLIKHKLIYWDENKTLQYKKNI